MKIWYQAYNTSARVDPKWRYYEEACERYIVKVARPDTSLKSRLVARHCGHVAEGGNHKCPQSRQWGRASLPCRA